LRKSIVAFFTVIILFAVTTAHAEGLLPSLTETVGIALPSLGEALGRYPDEETVNGDGSVTEFYSNITEMDFNTFSIYLEQQEAELADYKVEKGLLTAEIWAKGASFSLSYDGKSGEARVIYPSGTFDERVKNAKTHFDAAQKLLAEGKNEEAAVEIYSIPQYEAYYPVDSLMKEDENFAAAIEAKATREAKIAPYREAGSVVTFGTYPQTKKGTDQTSIEWIVLDYDETNHKTLLISKYGLDAVSYNKEGAAVTWERCTLRAWLNGEFLNKAFSTKEQSAILITNIDNSSDQGYSEWNTNGGNNTQDRIFLLSYAEANRYLGLTHNDDNNTKCRVAPTAYAIAQGARTSDSNKTTEGELAGFWWLRSPGGMQEDAAYVNSFGSLRGISVEGVGAVVCPAFWLNLESDFF